MKTEKTVRWYPTHMQMGKYEDGKYQFDAPTLERTMREVMRLHYELTDRVDAIQQKPSETPSSSSQTTNTASVSRLLGLPIFPSDTTQLADGTKLTYKAAQRAFVFE